MRYFVILENSIHLDSCLYHDTCANLKRRFLVTMEVMQYLNCVINKLLILNHFESDISAYIIDFIVCTLTLLY